MYRNQYDKDGTASAMGAGAQERFDEVIDSMGGTSTPSTKTEDIRMHIDRHVEIGDKSFSVDIKSAKATRRDGKINIDEVWVEIQNVQGNTGWLYGEQDFLAFELKKHNFVLVGRKSLAAFCEMAIDMKSRVSSPEEALYKLYQRKDRKDLISRIKLDVLNIEHVIIKKKEK